MTLVGLLRPIGSGSYSTLVKVLGNPYLWIAMVYQELVDYAVTLGLLFASLDVMHDMQNDSMPCTIEVHHKYLLMYCTVLN